MQYHLNLDLLATIFPGFCIKWCFVEIILGPKMLTIHWNALYKLRNMMNSILGISILSISVLCLNVRTKHITGKTPTNAKMQKSHKIWVKNFHI